MTPVKLPKFQLPDLDALGADAQKASYELACAASNAAGVAGQLAVNVGGAIAESAKKAGEAAEGIVEKAKDIEMPPLPEISFGEVLDKAVQVPGVKVDRVSYLSGALTKNLSAEMARAAVEATPADAGVPSDLIDRLADEAIAYEVNLAAATSFAAGLPGNAAAVVPLVAADLAQFYAHVFRIVQKLGYLYGWNDILEWSGDEMDDATRNELILFLGVMSGVDAAEKTLMGLAVQAGNVAGKRLARKALTKGAVYPVVKRVAFLLGVQMNKTIFGNAVGKAVPLVGGAISGGLTYATLCPMSLRLKNYLASTPLACSGFEPEVGAELLESSEGTGI